MAKKKIKRRAMVFDEKIWKSAEEELAKMQDLWILKKEFQEEETKEKNEKRQAEKNLKTEEMLKNDKLSQWDWKKKKQDRKKDTPEDTKDSSTLADIKISPSAKPKIIRLILKHDDSYLKVLKVKDCSTQVHPKDFDNSQSSDSQFDEASNLSPQKNKAKKKLKKQKHTSPPTLEWLRSIPPPVSDYVESWSPRLLELTPDKTKELKTLLAERRHSSYESPYARRLRQSVLSSSVKKTLNCPRKSPLPESRGEASNRADFDTNGNFHTRLEKFWNFGSPKCSKSSRTKQEYLKLYEWCICCGNQGVDIYTCPKCNKMSEFNKTI